MSFIKAKKDFTATQQKTYESGWLVSTTITTKKGSDDAEVSKVLLDVTAFKDEDSEYAALIASGSLRLVNAKR
jgi:hypothetical protein